jgi:hypothetical protein
MRTRQYPLIRRCLREPEAAAIVQCRRGGAKRAGASPLRGGSITALTKPSTRQRYESGEDDVQSDRQRKCLVQFARQPPSCQPIGNNSPAEADANHDAPRDPFYGLTTRANSVQTLKTHLPYSAMTQYVVKAFSIFVTGRMAC